MTERVEIIISATDQTSQVVRKITGDMSKAFKGAGQSITDVGNKISHVGMGLMAWTAPIGIIGGLGLKTFADFEDVLAEIQARTGATGEVMDSVKKKALDMGAATVFSGTESANAMLQLLASGYSLEETFAALPAVLDAAAAGGLDLGYTADVVTDALAMWNLGAEDATRVTDALARGAGASSAEINDLAQGLGNVGPIAAEFNLSIEDTVAVLAAFSERGIKGAEAGTQLRSMLNSMSKQTPKVTSLWKDLGISLFDTQGRMRPLQAVMGELSVELAAMTDEERIATIKTLGGAYGQMGLSILTSSDAIGDMSGLMLEQADAATVAQARMGTLRGIFDSVQGSIESLMINALEPFVEQVLKPMGDQLIVVINRLNAWITANPKLITQFVKMGAALVAAGPLLFGVGKAIALVGMAITALGNPLTWIIAIFGQQLLGVVKKVVTGFGDIADAFLEAGVHSSEMYETFQGIFGEELGEQIYEIVDGIVRMAGVLSEMGIAGITTLEFWYGLNDVFGSEMGNKLHELSLTFYDLYLNFKLFVDDVLIPFISKHSGTLIGIFTKLGAVLAGGVIIGSIVSIGASIMALINPVTLAIGAIVLLWQAWEMNLGGIQDFTKNKVVPVIKGLISVVLSIWDAVKPSLEKLAVWFVDDALPAMRNFVIDEVIPTLERLIEWLGRAWTDAKPHLQELALWFLDSALPAIVNFILDPTIPLIEKFIQTLVDLWVIVSPYLQQLFDWFITTALPTINNFMQNTVIPTIEKLTTGLKNIWDAAGPKLKEFYSWFNTNFLLLLNNVVTPFYNKIVEVVTQLGKMKEAMDLVSSASGAGADIATGPIGWLWDQVPGLAGGGSFQGLASVGEEGREYVYAPGGATVLPNGLTEQLMAAQGNTYNLNTSTSATSAGVEQDFRMMEAFAG